MSQQACSPLSPYRCCSESGSKMLPSRVRRKIVLCSNSTKGEEKVKYEGVPSFLVTFPHNYINWVLFFSFSTVTLHSIMVRHQDQIIISRNVVNLFATSAQTYQIYTKNDLTFKYKYLFLQKLAFSHVAPFFVINIFVILW